MYNGYRVLPEISLNFRSIYIILYITLYSFLKEFIFELMMARNKGRNLSSPENK